MKQIKKVFSKIKTKIRNQKGMGTVEWVVILAVTAILLGIAVPRVKTAVTGVMENTIPKIEEVTAD